MRHQSRDFSNLAHQCSRSSGGIAALHEQHQDEPTADRLTLRNHPSAVRPNYRADTEAGPGQRQHAAPQLASVRR